jgi:hypothetical protein
MLKVNHTFVNEKEGIFMKKKTIWSLCFFILVGISAAQAQDVKSTIAYKLAAMHTKNLTPFKSFINKDIEPPSSLVSEFQWIMDELKARCINPENAVADTIVETWMTFRKVSPAVSLLDTARELSKNAKNTTLFGNEKVNFRMTSKYWLAQQLGGKKKFR